MAVAREAITPGIGGFVQTPTGRTVIMMIGAALIVGAMSAVFLYSQQPDYRVLFSNFSDRDGGAIVASLQQMNIPYKYAEGGGAILVPANMVHDARLKLASQGLPKGGNVGFELMENQKLGVSQFLEQVNYQRALEGELARSIQSIGAVAAARVHLAMPKDSVFVRDQQKPTASVLVNLNAGRTLDSQQVSAIVHLVASSVPELSPKNVSVIDQNGNLLSDPSKPAGANGLDPSQLKYVQNLQDSIVKRIESIVTPIVGQNNVRAEATADVDFSQSEQAAEIYKPNQGQNTGSVRSQQSSETMSNTPLNASGVPGALSNQPPAPATAPITAPAGASASASANAAASTPTGNVHKDMTVNYEVDKTVRYVQQPMGGIKRLSVAVVVNYKTETNKDGKTVTKPLSEAEKNQISDLVKEAMGYNKDRGDTLNVVNTPFAAPEKEKIESTPIWKQPDNIQTAKEYGKYALYAVILFLMYSRVLKPLLARIVEAMQPPPPLMIEEEAAAPVHIAPRGYEQNLGLAKQLARDDPKVVANVVKAWVGGNE
jgi:flagellar M-ring protein FliF